MRIITEEFLLVIGKMVNGKNTSIATGIEIEIGMMTMIITTTADMEDTIKM
ncbi:hypothetical protein D3C78_1915420 [compost metagenome]